MHTNGIVIENETYGLSPRFAGFFCGTVDDTQIKYYTMNYVFGDIKKGTTKSPIQCAA